MKTSKLRVVVDTNIIFSALYDIRSNAGTLLFYAVNGGIDLYASTYIRNELERNLRGKLDYSAREFMETIKALPIIWMEDEVYAREITMAEKMIEHTRDIPVLALAISLGCDIVSGDKHFHSIDYKCWGLKELIKHLDEGD